MGYRTTTRVLIYTRRSRRNLSLLARLCVRICLFLYSGLSWSDVEEGRKQMYFLLSPLQFVVRPSHTKPDRGRRWDGRSDATRFRFPSLFPLPPPSIATTAIAAVVRTCCLRMERIKNMRTLFVSLTSIERNTRHPRWLALCLHHSTATLKP